MPPPDVRRQVGGTVWAKADAVSREAKRVYGAAVGRTWLRGSVLEVLSRRNEGGKRAVTYVRGLYMVGNKEVEATISLQTLKDKDPNSPGTPSTPSNTLSNIAPEDNLPALDVLGVPEDNENLAIGEDDVLQGMEQQPVEVETVREEEDDDESTIPSNSNRTPASTNHGRQWFVDATDVDMNGPVPQRP